MQKIKEMFRKTNIFMSNHKIYQGARKLLLVVYGCAFPFTILLALSSSLAVEAIPNGNLVLVYVIFSYLLPFSIFVSLIKILYDKNKSIFWFLLPLIIFVCRMGFSMYAVNHVQKEYQATQPIPFSERGLPIPATDVPVVLPPDPGEAGKATLAGIDSDHDGVRDDLEREIVYMYPQNQEVRRVLTAMVKKNQDIITTTGDHNYYQGLYNSYWAFDGCYASLIFSETGKSDQTTFSILLNMLINTPERTKKYDENTKSLYIPGSSPSQDQCDQPLVKGQY